MNRENCTNEREEAEKELLCYMAPLEGVTNYAYRNVHSRCFGRMDKYFTPFIVPADGRALRPRERKDVEPEHNKDLPVIPQILTGQAELFVKLAADLAELGYEEVNLNIGCPSGTVTNKGRGAGMLKDPEQLDRFLSYIFDHCPLKISVKTRVGVENPDEFAVLMGILNQYPMEELIVHPRVLKDFYQNHPHMEQFRLAYDTCRVPLIYNGDLFTVGDIEKIRWEYPKLRGIMLGRGLISNPALWDQTKGQMLTVEAVREFHDALYREQITALGGENMAMRHMKELWFYMGHRFTDHERYWKKLRKMRDTGEYALWVKQILREGIFDPEIGFKPPLK